MGINSSDGVGGGSGGGAPTDALYVVGSANGTLSDELVLGAHVIMSGVVASRPASAASGALYYATDDDIVYRYNGSEWESWAWSHDVLTNVSANDHHNQLHNNDDHTTAGTPGNSAVGDAAAQGSSASVARLDHTHGRESFGNVTAQTSFGASSGNGAATTLARSDHTHGTPALPELRDIAPFKHISLVGNGDKTTTSTSFVAVDTTNLAFLSISADTDDVIEVVLQCTILTSTTLRFNLDFEVDPPTGADFRMFAAADHGAASMSGGSARYNAHVRVLFTATESGSWGFRPMWMTTTGTITMHNATSGTEDNIIQFSVQNFGHVTA